MTPFSEETLPANRINFEGFSHILAGSSEDGKLRPCPNLKFFFATLRLRVNRRRSQNAYDCSDNSFLAATTSGMSASAALQI